MTVADPTAAQRAVLAGLYRRHVGPRSRYALVDFPDHANVGDSAIWLGELAMLREVTGRDPCHVATWHGFDAHAFHRDCPAGTLFLHGGGNLGDVWPHHQLFREHLLATVRDRPVVQLPQSIHFRDRARAARFATLAAAHPDLTLYVRDARSLVFARRHLACRSHLAPDSAVALGPQARGAADRDVLMLLRGDDERRDHGGVAPRTALVADWLEDDAAMPDGPVATSHAAQAAARVARGLRLLSRGSAIVTDRLHGHILATLLGIPHVVLDNDHGKIAAYRAAWATASPIVRTATTIAQAGAEADRLRRA